MGEPGNTGERLLQRVYIPGRTGGHVITILGGRGMGKRGALPHNFVHGRGGAQVNRAVLHVNNS